MSTSISPLQLKAWMIGNASYHVRGGQAYRDLCIELYRQDVSERISALLAKLDAQNDFLDALLTEGRVGCDEPGRTILIADKDGAIAQPVYRLFPIQGDSDSRQSTRGLPPAQRSSKRKTEPRR